MEYVVVEIYQLDRFRARSAKVTSLARSHTGDYVNAPTRSRQRPLDPRVSISPLSEVASTGGRPTEELHGACHGAPTLISRAWSRCSRILDEPTYEFLIAPNLLMPISDTGRCATPPWVASRSVVGCCVAREGVYGVYRQARTEEILDGLATQSCSLTDVPHW